MANNSVELALQIKSAVDGLGEVAKLAGEIEQLGGDATAVRQKAAQLAGEMDKLGKQQGLIDQFKQLSGAARTADEALAQSQQRTRELALQYKQSQTNIEAVSNALASAKRALSGTFDPAAAKVLQSEIKALEKELAAAEKESSQLGTAFEKSRAASRDWATAAQSQHLAAQKLGQQMAAAGLDAGKLEAAQARVAVGLKNAQSAMQAFGRDLASQAEHLRTTATASQDVAAKMQAMRTALDAAGAAGSAAIAKIDAQTAAMRRLSAASHDAMAEVTEARSQVGVKAFSEIEAEIQKTRQAFETLKNSGTLSHTEIAQAAIKTEEKIAALKAVTNGWKESLLNAKGAFVEAAAAGAGLKTVVDQAIQFESALSNVAKTTGLSDSKLADLGEELKQLATELPISADGLAKIAEAGGSLGVPAEQLEKFVALAAKMGVAFNIGAEEAGAAVGKLTTNFGLTLNQVSALGDAIDVLGNDMPTNEKEITDALIRIGGTSKQFGLAADEAAALATAMLSLGMPAEQAGTALNSMLTKLQGAKVGSADFQAGLERLNISAEQLAANIAAHPQQALSDFLHTLEKLDDQAKTEVLTQMFGQEHVDEVSRLVGSLHLYDQALKLIGDNGRTAGAMQREFEQRLKTTQAQLDLLKNSIENAAINLGSVFLPDIRAAAAGLADLTDSIAKFAHEHPTITKAAESIAVVLAASAALKTAFMALRLAGLSSFGEVAASFRAATTTLQVEAAAAGTQITRLGASMRALGSMSMGALGAGAYAALALEVGGLVVQLYELYNAKQKEKKAAEDAADAEVSAHARARRIAEENAQWAQQRILFADQIKGKSAEESAAYRDSLDKAARYWEAVATQAGRKTELHKDAEAQADRYRAAIAAATAAQQKNTGATQDAKTQADGLAVALDEAAKKGAEGAGKIGELVKQFDLLNPANADKLELAMRRLGSASEGAAKQVREGLVKSYQDLGGPELQAEIDALRAKTQQIGPVSREVATALDAGVREQFRRLGIDADQALSGVSAKIRDGITSLESLGSAGLLNGRTIRESLSNLLNQAKTSAEVQAVIGLMDRLKSSGVLAGKDISASYDEALAAMKRVGPSAEEVRAAQDKARISADQFAQAVEAAGGDFSNLNKVLAEHPALQRLAAQAAQDAKNALLLEASAATTASSEIHKLATAITQKELTHAAEIRQRQQAEQEASDAANTASERSTKNAQDRTKAGWNEIKEGEQLRSMYAQLYQELGKYSEEFVRQMHEVGAAHAGETMGFWYDIAWGAEKLKELTAQKAHVDELAAAIQRAAGSGDGLSEAIGRANIDLSDSADIAAQVRARFYQLGSNPALFQPLIDSLEQARAKLQALRQEAESTLRSLQDELDQLQGNQKAIEERDFEAKRAKIQADIEYSQQIGDAELQTKYREQLATLEKIHKTKLDNFRKEEEASKRQQTPTPTPAPRPAPAPAPKSGGDSLEDRMQDAMRRGDEAEAARIQNQILERQGVRVPARNPIDRQILQTEDAFRREAESRGQQGPGEGEVIVVRIQSNGKTIPLTTSAKNRTVLMEMLAELQHAGLTS